MQRGNQLPIFQAKVLVFGGKAKLCHFFGTSQFVTHLQNLAMSLLAITNYFEQRTAGGGGGVAKSNRANESGLFCVQVPSEGRAAEEEAENDDG